MERRIFAILNLHVNTLFVDDKHFYDLPEQVLLGIYIVEDGPPAHTRGLLDVAKTDPVVTVKDEQAERSTKQFVFMAFSHISLSACKGTLFILYMYHYA